MTASDTWALQTEHLLEADLASGQRESPFVGEYAEDEGEPGVGRPAVESWAASADELFASPFPDRAEAPGRDEAWAELATELRDHEFEEAIGELAMEAAAVHAEHASTFAGESSGVGAATAARAAEQHLEAVAVGAERMLDELAALAGEGEVAGLGEADVARLLESFEAVAIPTGGSPAFEDFLQGLRRLAGKVVSKVADLGRRGLALAGRVLPINAILGRLKALVRPLLQRVLSLAINRLPVALRPAALQLRRRFLRLEGEAAVTEAEELEELLLAPSDQAATGELEIVHQELHLQLAELLTASDEVEVELFDAELAHEGGGTDTGSPGTELDAARVRLIQELAALEDGESAAPAFERFLPAVLPALRIGIKVVGRDKVVRFLAGYLAKTLGRFVGRNQSRPLSQAIVDAGLRLLTLEAPSQEDERLAGPAALAAVAEETARAVLVAEGDLEDPVRLEAEAAVALQEALVGSFPASMLRADTLGLASTGASGPTWALRPRVYWYKKYTRIFEVTVTAQMAATITTFGGVTLAAALRAAGTSLPVRARVHCYEALAGTNLARISALEKHVPGLGADGWRRLHPLHTKAAAALLGEPGLGRDVDRRFTAGRNLVAAGQRLYHLEVPRPAGGGGGGDRRTCTPPSQGFVTVDGRRNEVRVSLYVCEAEAQVIAGRLRQGNTIAFIIGLRTAFGAGVRSVGASPAGRVRILREAGPTMEQNLGAVAGALGGKVAEVVVGKLLDAAVRLATDYARAKAQDFVRAVDDRRQGVTVVLTLPAPMLGAALRGGLAGGVASVGLLRTLAGLFSGRALPAMDTLPGLVRR